MVALCAIAWAGVAGCSGGGAPAPTPPTEPPAPAPDGDASTPAGMFDKALADARAALDTARMSVDDAVAASSGANTDETRTRAHAAVERARQLLDAAVLAAQALEPPRDDASRRGQAIVFVQEAEKARTDGNARLGTASGPLSWRTWLTAGTGPDVPAVGAVYVPRTIDTSATDDAQKVNPDALTDDSIPRLTYSAGKFVLDADMGSSADELRIDSYPFLYTIGPQNRVYPPDSYAAAQVAGLRFTPTGLVVRIGGPGSDHPFSRRVPSSSARIDPATVQDVGDPLGQNGWDLTLTFGTPTLVPGAMGTYFWTERLMPHPSQLAATAPSRYDATHKAKFSDFKRALGHADQEWEFGTFEIWLTNYSRLETHLEPVLPEADPHPGDDEHIFLKYAAYGLLTFEEPAHFNNDDAAGGAEGLYVNLINPFYVGYDAFEDAADGKPSDIAEASEVTSGKFLGQTMALAFDEVGIRGQPSGTPNLATAKRLRGDVELTATITSSTQTVSGSISELEVWEAGRYWTDYTALESVSLPSADIGNDGSYSGAIPSTATADVPPVITPPGVAYSGRFFGPIGELETAGVWYLGADSPEWGAEDGVNIAGSFGAKRESERQ